MPTEVHVVKALVFLLVMYRYESWTIKKTQCWRIDAFQLWCGEYSWESLGQQGDKTNTSSRKSTLNIHQKGWCWSCSSSTLATWLEEPTHWKGLWCWERLRAEGDRATEDEMVAWHHWLNGNEFEQAPRDSEGRGSLLCGSPWVHKELDTS